MDLKGKRLDVLERANECAGILGRPKHIASRFTHLNPGDRGVAVALQEFFEAEIAAVRAEFSAFRHQIQTSGDPE